MAQADPRSLHSRSSPDSAMAHLARLVTDNAGVGANPEIDAVFVYGIRQSLEHGQLSTLMWRMGRAGLSGEAGSVRDITFAYSIDALTFHDGLHELARRFLIGLQQLRTKSGSESDRPIVFASHDFGGTIVKKALVIASREETFKNLMASTSALVFFASPHRCNQVEYLQDKFLGLLQAGPKTHRPGLAGLAGVMARLTSATNAEFVQRKLLGRTVIVNVSSTEEDPERRVFKRSDVTFAVPHECCPESTLPHSELTTATLGLKLDPRARLEKTWRSLLSIRSSPAYPQSTRILDFSQEDCLTSHPHFRRFLQRRMGICVLAVSGRSGTGAAAEHTFRYLATLAGFGQDWVLHFEFRAHDERFETMSCMLKTIIAQTATMLSGNSIASAIRDSMEELFDDRVWTDDELYDAWADICRTAGAETISLVLGCIDECDGPSRNWFLSRISSSVEDSELPWKLVMTYRVRGDDKEIEATLSDLFSSGKGPRRDIVPEGKDDASSGIRQETNAPASTEEVEVPALYSLDLDSVGFVESSSSGHGACSWPLALRDPIRYPRSSELWSKLNGESDVQEVLAKWAEFNKERAEQVATSLLEASDLSFASVCRAILDSIPGQSQPWARKVILWAALSFRPLTTEELLAVSGIEEATRPDEADYRNDITLYKHFGGLFYSANGEVLGGRRLWEVVKSVSGVPGTEKLWYDFTAGDAQGHNEVAEACFRYLRRETIQCTLEKIGRDGPLSADERSKAVGAPLLVYAATYWPRHYGASIAGDGFARSNQKDVAEAFLADDKTRESWALAYHALVGGSTDAAAFGPYPPLRVASWLGFDHLLGRFGDGVGQQTWTLAAMEAAAHGCVRTLRAVFAIEPIGAVRLDAGEIIKAAASSKQEGALLEVLDRLTAQDAANPSWLPSLLLQSSRLGFVAVVRKLLAPPWMASPDAAKGQSQPLHYAAKGDYVEIAELLCKANADLEATPSNGPRPLTVACKHASPGVAKFLIKCGARVDIRDGSEGWTALQYASANGCPPAVDYLAGNGGLNGYGLETIHPLMLAARKGNRRCAEKLCRHGADAEMVVKSETPLGLAVGNKDIDTACMLLESGARVKSRNEGAESELELLHKSVQGGSLGLVTLLVEHGADVNAVPSKMKTPLGLAASLGHTAIAGCLIDAGAKVDTRGDDGFTPAYWAAWSGRPETLELLLERGADPDAEGKRSGGWRPIHAAYDQAKATRVLLRHGADRNAVSGRGTALHLAARYGYAAVVEALLDDCGNGGVGCDLEAVNGGETALTEALCFEGGDAIPLALLNAGANVNRTSAYYGMPLHVAVRRGNEALVAKMLQCRAEVDARDVEGNTPLNSVKRDTPAAIVRDLLNAGANVEAANAMGYTPVWTALQAGNDAVVRLLLGRGSANVNHIASGRSYYGSKAFETGLLQWACRHATTDLVEAIIKRGAANVNLDIPDIYGTPLQAACHRRKTSSPWAMTETAGMSSLAAEIIRLLKLLQESGATVNPPSPSTGGLGFAINAACLRAPLAVVHFLTRDLEARVDVRDYFALRTPLHLACYRDVRFVDAVLAGHGGATEPAEAAALLRTTRDITHRLPLHYAAATGKPDLVRHVLDKLCVPDSTPAADDIVNDADTHGWTPLHWAARAAPIWANSDSTESAAPEDRAAVVKLLIEKGAHPAVATARGATGHQTWTPLRVAHYHGAPKEVLDLLVVPMVLPAGELGLSALRRTKPSRLNSEDIPCDCCFMGIFGTAYECSTCSGYHLCFKCYGSRDALHPSSHGFFREIADEGDTASDDTSEDDSDFDADPTARPAEQHDGGFDENGDGSPNAEGWRWEEEEDGGFSLRQDS